MIITNLIQIIGVILTIVGKNMPLMIIGRILFGFAAGSFSVYVPKYINEISPIELKGPGGVVT